MMNKRYLTEDEQRRLLKAVQARGSVLAQRDHAWMRLLIETGMRINELATTTLAQAERALITGWLVIKAEQRKGKKHGHEYTVTAPVRESLQALIALHHELRPLGVPMAMALPLIWGRCGEIKGVYRADHMSIRSFQARTQEWAMLAGLPDGVSPHWMRHSRGVNIINRCRGKNPIKVVQLALGHESIASSGIYTQMNREAFEREMHNVAGGRMRKADARAEGQHKGANHAV